MVFDLDLLGFDLVLIITCIPLQSLILPAMETRDPSRSSVMVTNFVVAAFIFVFFFICVFSTPKNAIFSLPKSPPKVSMVKGDDLDAALEKASMVNNKTVIIAVFNRAYVEANKGDPINMFDLFLESIWLGEGTRPLIKNLLIVATDQTAYERCLFRGLHCYLLDKGLDLAKEMVYGSNGYHNLTWRKVLFCLRVIKKGYNFVFTDSDIVWLRNPFTRLSASIAEDIQFSTDAFNGDSRSDKNLINTGFYFVRSNNKTISLYERWCEMKDNFTGLNDQIVLQKLIDRGLLKELNVTSLFLETRYFSGFCQDSKYLNKVVTVHANCCRYISAKVKDLTQVLEDWKKFKGLSKNESSTMQRSAHINCRKVWGK